MRDFYRDRDSLRVELLPEGWDREGMAFSYRAPGTRAGETRNPFTPYIIASLALAAFAGALATRLFCYVVPLGTMAFSWQVIALFVAISLVDGMPSYFGDDPPEVWITRFLRAPLVWATIVLLAQPPWVLLVVVLLVTLLLADALAGNYLAWLLADARLDSDTRELIRRRWKGRFARESWLTAVLGLFGHNRRPRVLDHYLVGLLLLAAAFGVGLLALACMPAYTTGMVVVLALLAYLPLQALALPHLLGLKRVPARLQAGVVARALSNWLSYNPRDRWTPGLHLSPYGAAWLRLSLFAAALLVAGASLNVAACFFPVLMLGPEGTSPWLRVGAERRAAWGGGPSPDPEVRLSPRQRLYYEQLEGEERRSAYLLRAARAQAAARRAPVGRRDAGALTTPESWIPPNYAGAWRGRPLFLWTFILALVLGMAVPPLLLFAACWSAFGHELALLELRLTHPDFRQHRREEDGAPEESPAWYDPEWQGYIDALHNSPNPLEREHLFLGFAQDFDTDDESPVLMHRDMLREHVHVTGDSGSGKSSRGIAAMAAQLCRFARERGDCSLLVIDLKGDDALFHGIRHEARGLPFKWYREQIGCTTFGFNPLMQSHMEYYNPEQKGRAVMDAFGLRYQDGGADRYFADIQEEVLSRLFRHHPEVRSLADLHRLLQDRGIRERLFPNTPQTHWDNSYHVRSQLGAFANSAPLNDTSGDPDRCIDLPSLFARPQVVYFYVPALMGGGANQQAAKFALYALLTSALFIPKSNRHQVYCIIDEFQEIIGANLGVILKQARSFDVGMVLANQLPSDLNRGGVRLHDVLTATTALRWSFRASDLAQQRELQEASGEYIEYLRTVNTQVTVTHSSGRKGGSESVTRSVGTSRAEVFRPAFSRNRILWANFVDDLSIAHFARGNGYTQFFRPFPLRTMFHISRELYEKRSREPWPLLPWPPGRRDGAAPGPVPGPADRPLPPPDGGQPGGATGERP
ncbi:type IV secretory system conjugative DNA transfer family protein [Tautonia sociabilis]|uniref:ATP-binding protein n=1 Tax=Tautonia sociabilis TaxID=2080755 RepID=A0A432MI03_9BACT|nr:ATP-binding protein [Tautonia sociabilis]RUL86992.1 ATP-binding protein [Tautonia sociabilis]